MEQLILTIKKKERLASLPEKPTKMTAILETNNLNLTFQTCATCGHIEGEPLGTLARV